MRLPPLVPGTLLRRYKRFLADVRLDDGRELTAHCANPGAMTSCAVPGWRVWLSHHDDRRRKLAWSWELVQAADTGGTVLVNTARPNRIVGEALVAGSVPELAGQASVRPEVRFGERSRVDFLLEGGHARAPEGGPGRCWVEVKSVTLRVDDGVAAFPDAVTERGTRHLRELSRLAVAGDRAVLFFLLGRTDCDRVRPADEIDPVYGQALREAVEVGVEVMAWRVAIDGAELGLDRPVGVDLAR